MLRIATLIAAAGNGDVVSMLTCNDPPDTRKHVQLSAHL